MQADVLVQVCKAISSLLALLGFFAGLTGAYALFHKPITFPRQGGSLREVVFLPARGIYGPQPSSERKGEVVEFRFSHAGEEELLFHFVPGWVQEMSQIVVQLNGIPIGYLPPCRHGWGIEQRLLLPKYQLSSGSNRISFSPQLPKSGIEMWSVRDLYVTPVRSHSLEEESEQALLKTAERIFREGRESPSQLARARRLVRQAIESFHLDGKEVPREANDLKTEILDAHTALFVQSMSEARKATGLGDVTRARSIYSKLLSEWIDLSELQRSEVNLALSEISP